MTVIAQDDHLTAGAWAACAKYYNRKTLTLNCLKMSSVFDTIPRLKLEVVLSNI